MKGFGPWLVGALMLGACVGSVSIAHQAVDVTEETKVDGDKARDYFRVRNQQTPASSSGPRAGGPRYLAVQAGTFFSEEVYRWGKGSRQNVGRFDGAATYKIGEWVESMDLWLRLGLSTFDLEDGNAVRLNLMPMVVFPDSASGFPLYFGGGLGLGIFFKQLPDESALSLDYTILTGVRFLDVFEGGGFLVEGGLKNHIFLLSDGQLNALYLNLGAVFSF